MALVTLTNHARSLTCSSRSAVAKNFLPLADGLPSGLALQLGNAIAGAGIALAVDLPGKAKASE